MSCYKDVEFFKDCPEEVRNIIGDYAGFKKKEKKRVKQMQQRQKINKTKKDNHIIKYSKITNNSCLTDKTEEFISGVGTAKQKRANNVRHLLNLIF